MRREVLVEDRVDVVAHDVGVPDDGGVVDNLADAVDDEHDVGDVGETVCKEEEVQLGRE